MNVVFSAKAEQDLAGLFDYINDSLHNHTAAHNILMKILRLAQKLSTFPEMGTPLHTLDSRFAQYRYLLADNYLLIYRFTDDAVCVVRIVYAKSDYVQLLEG